MSTAFGTLLTLSACNSDDRAAFGSGGGGGPGPTAASSDGTLSRTVDIADDLSGGALSSSGNAALGAVTPAANSADNTLNGVAKGSFQDETVVGSSDPSSSQLLGVNALSSSQNSGTVGTATLNQSSSEPSGLLGASAGGSTVVQGGTSPIVGVNAAPPQGSVATGTVNLPQNGATTGGTGNLLGGGVTGAANGVLGGIVPGGTATTSTTGGP